MRFAKKFILSLSWLTVAVIISAVLGLIAGEAPPRETTGQQASATAQLLLMGFAGLLPIVMAILVWFGRPRWLYKTHKSSIKAVDEYAVNMAQKTHILADVMVEEFGVKNDERIYQRVRREAIYHSMFVTVIHLKTAGLSPQATKPIVDRILTVLSDSITVKKEHAEMVKELLTDDVEHYIKTMTKQANEHKDMSPQAALLWVCSVSMLQSILGRSAKNPIQVEAIATSLAHLVDTLRLSRLSKAIAKG